ncbi:MAG: hypothetical protein SVS85_02655, partial [Candidatus Nanohaloarchaea archaeon]|nr:hypothetical protein [Candidatus Nanohaloarchaea archaeon]
MMKRLALLLVMAVLLSGCTVMGEESSSTSGVEIGASLADSRIFSDSSTTLHLEITNYNSQPLRGLKVELVNTGGLKIKKQVSGCEEDIGASTRGVPRTKSCIWKISSGKGFESDRPVTVPLTLLVTYSSTLTSVEDSIKVRFVPEEELSPGTQSSQSLSLSNGDLKLTATHSSPVSAEAAALDMTISVSNIGKGSLQSLSPPSDTREVRIGYEGSFAELGGGLVQGLRPDSTTCLGKDSPLNPYKEVSFLEGRKTSSF